jgi:hypothetical protein
MFFPPPSMVCEVAYYRKHFFIFEIGKTEREHGDLHFYAWFPMNRSQHKPYTAE